MYLGSVLKFSNIYTKFALNVNTSDKHMDTNIEIVMTPIVEPIAELPGASSASSAVFSKAAIKK